MNLHQLYLTENACYQTGKNMNPKGIFVHSTGANNPNLCRYVGPDDGLLGQNKYNNHWNRKYPDGRSICVHGFIGKLKDGTIATYQTLPWDRVGWHSGQGTKGNANYMGYIGFEICEDGLEDKAYCQKTYNEALDLCEMLCKKYNISVDNVIGHFEGYQQGIASNHGDPKHWWSRHGLTMEMFRAELKKRLATPTPTTSSIIYRIQLGAFKDKSNADAYLKKVKEAGFTDAFIKEG